MRRFNIILATLGTIAVGSVTTQAQELQQQVDVQHTTTTKHHDATRMSQTPQLVLPAVATKPLQFSERTVHVAIPDNISFLEPTAYADTLATSPYNGYASIGYLPVYNLGASAGYKILNNDRHRLSVWGQFDGNSYEDINDKLKLHRNTLSLGADYHYLVGKESEIDASIDYTLARFNAPGKQFYDPEMCFLWIDDYKQTVNRVNVNGQFISAFGGLKYTAGLGYHHFGYAKGFMNDLLIPDMPLNGEMAEVARPVRENQFMGNVAASLALSSTSAVYLGLDIDVISNTRRSNVQTFEGIPFSYTLVEGDSPFNHGLLTLNPRYRLKNNNLTMTIGAKLQMTFNSGKFFHVAPDVNVTWSPASIFTIWGKAGGGEHQNTLGELYDINYMTLPCVAYKNSHIPITVDGGIVLTPLPGAFAELYGGYAIANDWLMPTGFMNMMYQPTFFKQVNLKGWHAGVTLGYSYRSLAQAKVTFEAAPQKYDRGYYLWRDRAKYMIKAEVTVNPIEKLQVGLGYELRACRVMIDRDTYTFGGTTSEVTIRENLGNISNLSINGAYRITPQWTAFLTVENLLNRRTPLTLGLVETQGIRGLLGVSYKF